MQKKFKLTFDNITSLQEWEVKGALNDALNRLRKRGIKGVMKELKVHDK